MILADLLWRQAGEHSLEHFRLVRSAESWTLHGVVLKWADDAPLQVRYAVTCDASWNTVAVRVTSVHGARIRRLRLERNPAGAWHTGRQLLSRFDGIADIDLEVTPATNTLPIRRLALNVGESAPADALWVRFPDLTLERLSQRYTRVADDAYRYESGGGEFQADLVVDDEGVVVRYGSIWDRVRS